MHWTHQGRRIEDPALEQLADLASWYEVKVNEEEEEIQEIRIELVKSGLLMAA